MKEDKQKTELVRFKTKEDYKKFLDSAPDNSWLQNRSLGSKNHSYIPIFITEANADFIMDVWNVVSEEHKEVGNGIMCTVRIEATPSYPDAQPIFFTGSAATQYKDVKNHLEFDVPNAREKAIGKAFATLGNVFGRSLNRSYTITKGSQSSKQIIKKDFSFIPKDKDEA